MQDIGVGIVGGGFIGNAHAVAMSAMEPVFETSPRPRLEMVTGSTPESSKRMREKFGFRRAADDWQALVADPAVEAIIIASPQSAHRAIGHGTGYQDQIIIEAKDFLLAIETGQNLWPTVREGLEVAYTVAAIREPDRTRSWQNVGDF